MWTARFNYLDMASQERNQVTLLIDGKELPSLELPGTGRKPGRFLRIKLAAGISLSSGGHEVEIRANAPWKKMTIKALLAEKVTIPHRWQLVWNEEFEQDGFPAPAKWRGEEGLLRNQEPQYYTRCVDNPQYIILNHAVGSYSGKVPPEIDSMSFYIDYVRVYQ